MSPMRALTRPRHLALSVLVALVASGIGATVASGGSVASEDDPSPPVFSTPAPMVGDRVEYHSEGREPLPDGRIEVKAQETFRNATHTMEGIVVLHGPDNTSILDPLSLRPVAYVRDDAWKLPWIPFGVGLPTDESSSTRLHRAYFGGEPTLPCGFFHPWMDWPYGVEIEDPPCRFEGPLRWEIVSVEATNGSSQAWTALLHEGVVAFRMVLQDDIPYPVRIEKLAPDGTVQDAQVMVGFTRGRTDLVSEVLVHGHLPQAELAAGTAWFLEDSGIAVPFRLSAAFDHATDDPLVGDFLAQNPGSYLYHADLLTGERTRTNEQVWELAFSDGQQVLDVEVAQRQWRLAAVRDQVTVAVTQREYDAPSPLPQEDQLPALSPSMESLERIWQAYRGPMESYGFTARCEDPECTEPSFEVRVGRNGVQYDLRDDALREPGRHDAEALLFDHRGVVVGFSTTGMQRNLLPPAPAEVSAGPALPERVTDSHASAAVTGAASVALLAALLYFLHPLLKSGPIALFTRIRRDKILDHAGRAKIHDVIAVDPGIHYRALRESLGMANGTLQHHLQKLVEAGLVVVVKGPRHSCYFLKGSLDRRDMLAAPMLKSSGARRVFETVQAHPGLGTKEIARQVALSPSTVHYHLRRLAEAEMVCRRMQGSKAAWTT